METPEKRIVIASNGIFSFSAEMVITPAGNLQEDINSKFGDLFDGLFDEGIFDEEIENAVGEYSPEANGVFSVDNVITNIYEFAHKYVDELESDIHLTASEATDTNLADSVIELDAKILLDRIHEKLRDREESEQSACDAGSVIEKCLHAFEKKSSWQAGYISAEHENEESKDKTKIPAIWFGEKDEAPLRLWTLSENMSEDDLDFWYPNDSWYVMEAIIGEPNDWFLTWYFPECGCVGPDVDRIRSMCPIDILETDNVESISQKIKDYFIEHEI